MLDVRSVELQRQAEQERLDSLKTPEERNQCGQFATRPPLAFSIAQYAKEIWDRPDPVRFLDPAIGTGAFFSAALHDTGLHVSESDFTSLESKAGRRFNLLLTNPPYVRHHHMDWEYKTDLKRKVARRLNIQITGLAGLYSFFLLLADSWLEDGALSIWLIPFEFMDVNYGAALREYLTTQVELLRIHRFCPSDIQFSDALVSSAIVVFRKKKPSPDISVQMTFAGPITSPVKTANVPLSVLKTSHKWTGFPNENGTGGLPKDQIRLGDLFKIKRGLATGSNEFFILTEHDAKEHGIPKKFQRPILPGPRFLMDDIIERDENGFPKIAPRLVLIDCPLPEVDVRDRYPQFWEYLKQGKKTGVDKAYLTSKRNPWYSQEKREAPPFLFTYMGRAANGKQPFRVIWNQSEATAHNVYLLLYPKPELAAAFRRHRSLLSLVFEELRNLDASTLLGEGRVYGGGLHKLEPRELERVPIQHLAERLKATADVSLASCGEGDYGSDLLF